MSWMRINTQKGESGGRNSPLSFYALWVWSVGVKVGGRRAQRTGKELNSLSDLGDVQGSGHFLQLCLHRAVAKGSLQNRLLDSQELTHLFQICKMHTIDSQSKKTSKEEN